MTFQPVVPVSGYAGWRYLDRTAARQQALHAESPAIKRDTAVFRERIAGITSAEALVSNLAVLKVALGAFGLEGDLGNRAFLQRILESAPGDPTALANRIADKRYQAFARAFGFAGPGGPYSTAPGFADRIVAAYETRSFEVAVGGVDESMRLALAARRELETLATGGAAPDTAWFSVMGQPPLRKVFETALGLPAGFGALDLDRQLSVFREKTERALGNGEIAQFADPARREDLVRLFLLRSDIQVARAGAAGSTALALLQAPRIPG